MKNTLYILAALLFNLAMARSNELISRNGLLDAKNSVRYQRNSKIDTIDRKDFATARLNSFSAKAVRHFEKSFGEVSEKHWYILVDGSIAYFKKDGVQKKAAYDESGNWLHTLSFYEENKLPTDVRRLVKREYYDYSIYLVVEIEKDNRMVYIVKMENSNALITVRIWEDEMQEIENYRKSSTKYLSLTCDIQTPASR